MFKRLLQCICTYLTGVKIWRSHLFQRQIGISYVSSTRHGTKDHWWDSIPETRVWSVLYCLSIICHLNRTDVYNLFWLYIYWLPCKIRKKRWAVTVAPTTMYFVRSSKGQCVTWNKLWHARLTPETDHLMSARHFLLGLSYFNSKPNTYMQRGITHLRQSILDSHLWPIILAFSSTTKTIG